MSIKNLLVIVSVLLMINIVSGAEIFQKIQSGSDIQQFVPLKNLTYDANKKVFTAGSAQIYGMAFAIDPRKKYTLSGSFRNISSGRSGPLYFGFALFDEEGLPLSPGNVKAIPGTETLLAKAAKKGDTRLFLADASKWKKGLPASICAFYVKKDLSDLPNRSVASIKIKTLKKVDGLWQVTLNRPLEKDHPISCAVRQHQGGGGMYTSSFGGRPPKEWKRYSGSVAPGIAKSGNPPYKWWKGARYASILIMSNFGYPKGKIQFKDIVLTIEDSGKGDKK